MPPRKALLNAKKIALDQEINAFIQRKYRETDGALDSYDLLDQINLPDKIIRFPYNLMRIEVTPTYKTILTKHIEGKKYLVDFVKKPFRGGSNADILQGVTDLLPPPLNEIPSVTMFFL